jgi:PAS domain S-box-containing protein
VSARESSILDALDFLDTLREPNDLKIWARMLEKLAAALNAEGALYLYYDTLAGQLVAFNAIGSGPSPTDPKPSTIGQGLAGWSAKFKQSALVPELNKDERYDATIDTAPGIEAGGALVVPLLVNLDFVGVFEFFAKQGAAFTAEDLKLAEKIISHSAHTIRRLRLEDQVNRVTAYNSSILDNLSGGFFAVDLQGRVMICNPAARRILGIHGDVTDLAVEKALPHLSDLAAVLRETLSSKKTVKRRDLAWTLDGTERLLGYSTMLIQDTQGAFAGAGVTFQDITKFKK